MRMTISESLLPRRGTTNQPRATPWETEHTHRRALKGHNMDVPAVVLLPFQGRTHSRVRSFSQGVALGSHVPAPLGHAVRPCDDAGEGR
jgi:hypothetical protein